MLLLQKFHTHFTGFTESQVWCFSGLSAAGGLAIVTRCTTTKNNFDAASQQGHFISTAARASHSMHPALTAAAAVTTAASDKLFPMTAPSCSTTSTCTNR